MTDDDAISFPPLLANARWAALGQRHGLTPRELDVVKLICRGLTNARMCERLEVSRNTLRTHTRNVYQKLDRRNRLDLTLWIVHSEILRRPEKAKRTHPQG